MIKRILKIFAGIVVVLIIIAGIFITLKAREVDRGKARIDEELKNTRYGKFSSFGYVRSVSILPLIDYYTDRIDLRTEPGVSYLIKADSTTILMDAGFNQNKEHPSPLLQNMKKLGIKFSDIDLIFVSHNHMDHIGSGRGFGKMPFAITMGKIDTGDLTVYAPEKLTLSHWNPDLRVKVVKDPEIIKPGIASIGSIPRFLFLAGLTLEHSLAINIKGKGIVLIIGCGHQTIERIIERTKMIFDEPIYAVIGGLHYPVQGGRIYAGPLNLQYIVGSDRPPWRGLSKDDVKAGINAIAAEKPSIVSLSPHDSSDWTISEFIKAFKDNYVDLKVGSEIKL